MPVRLRLARTRAVALLAGAAFLACVRKPPADLSREPRELLAEVRAAQAKVKRVRGSGRVDIRSPRGSGSTREWIAAEKPDKLRLETLDFFGNVAAVLVADGKRFALYDARASIFYRGEPTPENISRLLPVALPAHELATILCGSAPLLQGEPISVGVDDGLLLLTIGAGDTGQRLGIGEEAAIETSLVRRIVTGAGGRSEEVAPAYDLELSRFRHPGGVRFPLKVRLDAPGAEARIELAWSEVEVNAPAEDALFHLDPPQGARVVDLPGKGE